MKKNNKIEFSLCSIYKDEENFLEGFINNHIDLFEELILVDTGSTDKSNEITKSYNLKNYFYKWDNNFSNARNASLSYATKPYIIVLDIDEQITAEGVKALKKIIQKEGRDGYSLKQINFSDSMTDRSWKHISLLQEEISIPLPKKLSTISNGYINSPLIRVFRNGKGIYFSGMIHEIVGDSMEKFNLSSIKTDIPIFHFGWLEKSRTEENNEIKKKKYNALIKKAWETEGTAKAGYYYLTTLNSPEEKMKLVFKLIKSFPNVKEFYQIRALAALDQNQFQRAISYADKGLDIFPEDINLLSVKVKCLNRIFKPNEALNILEKILKKDPYNFKNYIEKITALIVLKKKDEAEKTIKNLPEDIPKIYKTELLNYLKKNI